MNSKEAENRKDTIKAALTAAFLLALAILYLLSGIFFGFYIPCPIKAFTGFRCPGCGMSHAATYIALAVKALITDDMTQARHYVSLAIRANALFVPISAYLFYSSIRFLRDEKPGRIQVLIDSAFLIIILIWWVVRNLYGM